MKSTLFPAALIIISGLLGSTIQASPSLSFPNIQLAQNTPQSLDEAVQTIKQQTGGRILSTKTVTQNGQQIYKIKVLLPSGKVQIFKVSTP